MPSRMLMSVANPTSVFGAGTTADDAVFRVVTGKDSSEAFIESSADPWHGLTGLLRSARLLRRVCRVLLQPPGWAAEATQTAHLSIPPQLALQAEIAGVGT